MTGISLREVSKSFGRQQVIHGVNCEVAGGEFVVIVGPSGCGKSTQNINPIMARLSMREEMVYRQHGKN